MVKSVNRVVIFLSIPYIKSPNCCVEFWEAAQYPSKLRICVLERMPTGVEMYLKDLKSKGAIIVIGIPEYLNYFLILIY